MTRLANAIIIICARGAAVQAGFLEGAELLARSTLSARDRRSCSGGRCFEGALCAAIYAAISSITA